MKYETKVQCTLQYFSCWEIIPTAVSISRQEIRKRYPCSVSSSVYLLLSSVWTFRSDRRCLAAALADDPAISSGFKKSEYLGRFLDSWFRDSVGGEACGGALSSRSRPNKYESSTSVFVSDGMSEKILLVGLENRILWWMLYPSGDICCIQLISKQCYISPSLSTNRLHRTTRHCRAHFWSRRSDIEAEVISNECWLLDAFRHHPRGVILSRFFDFNGHPISLNASVVLKRYYRPSSTRLTVWVRMVCFPR